MFFLRPIVQSFKHLQKGILLYDFYRNESFMYRAHLTHLIGDTPAINKMMGIKGTNSVFPCRNCRIQAHHGPVNTFYPCLHPPNEYPSHNQTYNPSKLPLWNHKSFKDMANAINDGKKWLIDNTGIKYKSPLLELSSILPPWCFCIDSMHLILENIVKSTWKSLMGIQKNEFTNNNTPGNDVLSKEVINEIENEIKVICMFENSIKINCFIGSEK